MSDLRPFFQRVKMPLQTAPLTPGAEAKVILPWVTSYVYVSDETGVSKGFVISNTADALKYGLYFRTYPGLWFQGPWYGRDIFLAVKTAGQVYLNVLAFPLWWTAQPSPPGGFPQP